MDRPPASGKCSRLPDLLEQQWATIGWPGRSPTHSRPGRRAAGTRYGRLAITLVAAVGCGEISGPVARIEVTPNRVTLDAGDSLSLTARLLDAAGNEVRGRVSWLSSDTAVARVTGDGVVVGAGDGGAVVRATFHNRVGAATVQVTRPAGIAAGDSLVPSVDRVVLIAGETAQLAATLVTQEGDTVTDVVLQWTSADDRIANVSATGAVTARATGTTIITVGMLARPLSAEVSISVAPTFLSISAGADHACGVTVGGDAYCWGKGEFGRLGTGILTDDSLPGLVLTTGAETVAALEAGTGHSCALTTDGTALCWGLNDEGQLGIGSADDADHPVRVPVTGGMTFSRLSVGGRHTCAEAPGGGLYCWGSGAAGQVSSRVEGQRERPTEVPGGLDRVAAGAQHTCALDPGGTAWCWGSNTGGQLGSDRQPGLQSVASAETPELRSLWGFSATDLVATGRQRYPFCVENGLASPPLLALVAESEPNDDIGTANPVAVGDTVAGTICCYGVKNPDPDFYRVVFAAGDTIDIDLDLGARMVLYDSTGRQLRESRKFDEHPRIVFATRTGGTYYVLVSSSVGTDPDVGWPYLLAITGRSKSCPPNLYRFGSAGWQAQAGVDAGLRGVWGSSTTDVYAVGDVGTVLHYDGIAWIRTVQGSDDLLNVWGSGSNDVFAVGEGGVIHFDGVSWAPQTVPTSAPLRTVCGTAATDVWAGSEAGELLHYNGAAWTTVASGYGAIDALWARGANDVFAIASRQILHYDGGSWTVQQTFSPTVTLGGLSGWPGAVYTVANDDIGGGGVLRYDGDEWREVARFAGAMVANAVWSWVQDTTFFVTTDITDTTDAGTPNAAGSGQLLVFDPGLPAPVDGTVSFTSLAAGVTHTCGVAANGQSHCWGNNIAGQLGIGTDEAERRQPTLVTGGQQFVSLAASAAHSCGLTPDGMVYCWGRNAVGEVGDGTNSLRRAPVLVEISEPIAAISVGVEFSCAVSVRGVAYCWGSNDFGQLGDGTTEDRLTPVRVAGPR